MLIRSGWSLLVTDDALPNFTVNVASVVTTPVDDRFPFDLPLSVEVTLRRAGGDG